MSTVDAKLDGVIAAVLAGQVRLNAESARFARELSTVSSDDPDAGEGAVMAAVRGHLHRLVEIKAEVKAAIRASCRMSYP